MDCDRLNCILATFARATSSALGQCSPVALPPLLLSQHRPPTIGKPESNVQTETSSRCFSRQLFHLFSSSCTRRATICLARDRTSGLPSPSALLDHLQPSHPVENLENLDENLISAVKVSEAEGWRRRRGGKTERRRASWRAMLTRI